VLASVHDYFDRLNRSLAACYRLLEQPRVARRAVVGLLTIQTALLAYSAYVHSPTLNEPGHLVAGLSIWKFGRFDVYNVNPPLVKMVAALPVMAVGYEEDWSGFYTGPGARPEFAMGEDFVAANGERSFFLFMIARWACIPFSWIGAVVCYLWARDLFGRPAGVVACAIWCFEPNILAHASLITPDAHATALGLAACYTFWRWLKRPTWGQAALTGVVLGLAELAKTTLILFYPLWPVMWVIYRLMERRKVAISLRERLHLAERDGYATRMSPRDWLREGGMLALRMAIGLYVLNLGYAFEGALQPLGEFHFVSDLFTGKESGARDQESGNRANPDSIARASQLAPRASSTNRFAGTWFASMPSPFPKNYLLGIDLLQQKDFEHYGRPSYLRGEWRDHGWWYYYLYAMAIKVPLGLWALGVFALMASAAPWFRGLESGVRTQESASEAPGSSLPTPFRDLFILLFPALVIFAVVSSKTGMNEHMRYVLPSFPFLFVGLSGCLKNLLDNGLLNPLNCLGPPRTRVRRGTFPVVLALLAWFGVSSAWIYPHSLSYFNESIGGPRRGPEHLLGSNVDWGQDLRYLQRLWHDGSGGVESNHLHLAYYGGLNPRDLGLHYSLPSFVEQDAIRINVAPGQYFISMNLLYGYPWTVSNGAGEKFRLKPRDWWQLRKFIWAYNAGYCFAYRNLN
jgi:hypothetical protein